MGVVDIDPICYHRHIHPIGCYHRHIHPIGCYLAPNGRHSTTGCLGSDMALALALALGVAFCSGGDMALALALALGVALCTLWLLSCDFSQLFSSLFSQFCRCLALALADVICPRKC